MKDIELEEEEESYNVIQDQLREIESYEEPEPEPNQVKRRPNIVMRLDNGLLIIEAIQDLPLN